MPKASILCNSFNSGEVSELIESRSDLSKFQAACKTLENAFPLVEGGAKKMPGTMFVTSTKDPGQKALLVPFSFSTTQTYILEFGNLYIRFYTNGGQVVNGGVPVEVVTPYLTADLFALDTATQSADVLYIFHPSYAPQTLVRNSAISFSLVALAPTGTIGQTTPTTIQKFITGATQTNPCTITCLNHGLVTGDTIYINDVTGMTELNYQQYTVTVASALSEFDPTSAYSITNDVQVGRYCSCDFGTGKNLYLAAPYAFSWGANTLSVNVTSNSIDTLAVTFTPGSPNLINIALAKSTSAKNSANLIQAAVRALGGALDTTAFTVTENPAYAASRPTTGVSILNVAFTIERGGYFACVQAISSSATNTNHFPPAEALFWTAGTPVTDPENQITLNGIDATTFIAYVSGGWLVQVVPLFQSGGTYPACGTFFEQRLMLGGSDDNPVEINGSVQGDYADFISDPAQDDHAVDFTLVSQKLDQVQNMVASPNALLLGTAGGVWAMAGTNGAPLSATNINAQKQTTIGVSALRPQLLNDSAVFVSRSTRIVTFLSYNFVSNQWDTFDLTRLNRNITIGTSDATSGIVQTAFQSEPYPIFWAVRADGQLIGLVFNKQDQVFAWFRINMSAGGGLIESVACISQNNQEDQVWIIVNRTINGSTVRYIEYFMPQEIFGQLANAFFVHCGLQWTGGPSAAITGISQANPCVVTAPGHGFTNGASIQITGVQGMTQSNQGPASAYTITWIDANTFSLNGITSLIWSPYTSGGTATPVTNTITGAAYLQGETAVAVGDGAKIWRGTVPASGSVTFPFYANLITIGLPFTTTIEPMNPILGTREQTSKGKRQKISRATFSLYQSIGGKYGDDQAHLHALAYGSGAKGLQPQLFTGNITRDLDGEWEDEATISVVHDEPFPFCLRAIIPRIDVAEAG